MTQNLRALLSERWTPYPMVDDLNYIYLYILWIVPFFLILIFHSLHNCTYMWIIIDLHRSAFASRTSKTSKTKWQHTSCYNIIHIYNYIFRFAFISMFCLPNKLHLKHSILLPRVCLLNMTKVFINIFASTKEMISDV